MGEWHYIENRRSGQWKRNVGGEGTRKNKASESDDEGFFCLWGCCRAAKAHQKTRPGKDCCHACERVKGTAMNPPLGKMVQWGFELRMEKKAGSAPSSPSGPAASGSKVLTADGKKGKGVDKKDDGLTEEEKALRDSRTALLKGVDTTVPPAPPESSTASASAMDTSTAAATAPTKDQVQRRKIMGIYVSPTGPGSEALYQAPSLKTLKPPATFVAEALSGNAAQAFETQSERVTLLVHQIAQFKGMPGTEHVVKEWEGKLKTAEAALDKISKKKALSSADPAVAAAAANAEVESLQLAKQAEVRRQAELSTQESTMAVGRVTKNSEDLAHADEMISLAQQRRSEIAADFNSKQEEWAKLYEARGEQHREILVLFDLKISNARQLLGNPLGTLAPEASLAPVAAAVQSGGPSQLTPGLGEAGDEEEDEDEAQAAADYELLDDSVTTIDQLPVLDDKLTPEQKAYVENAWGVLRQVLSAADLPRMPFGAFQITPAFAKQLLGDDMWRGFFGPTRVVTQDDVVPRCMVGAIDVALRRMGAQNTALEQKASVDAAGLDTSAGKKADVDKKAQEEVATIREWRLKEKTRKAKLAAEKTRKNVLVKK